ncbi:sugar phosphate isomerase/epimerase [Brachybacterium paraconglomeratum]|uniref:sugar phosphate isomerase/epimerase family protein n=1 Tax=Brachybacterium paraconglomeratum TaxID=173362 RepID=UPI0031EF2088
MIRPGLCSVTFRDLDVESVIGHAVAAELECIEWAGDAHVPPGDPAAARRARELTEQAGLAVASYGSYLRFEGSDEEFRTAADGVLMSAQELGAPRIRVWAGSTGSADVPAEDRVQIIRRIQRFADRTAEHGIDVGLEFHGRTLTDEIGSTLHLLDEVDRINVLSYWQPHQGMDAPEALETLRQVLPRTSTIHVFSWWPTHERLALSERAALWRDAFAILAAEGSDRDALLEFLPGDDPALLRREADALRSLIAAGTSFGAEAAR